MLRKSLAATAIAAGLAGAGVPMTALASGRSGGGTTQLPQPTFGPTTDLPVPIPGTNALGFHTGAPAAYMEPSLIYNFYGDVALAQIAGTGYDSRGRALSFGGPTNEFRFMRGKYVTADGKQHYGTWVHV